MLIYAEHTSTRLQYVCKFIFDELMGISFSLTLHEGSFSRHAGPKINYSNNDFCRNAYQINPCGLLFEAGIRPQQIKCSGEGESAVFFESENADHSFDIFSAVFYLISRYEEYLPYDQDTYGRYAHTNSLAFKHHFLRIPLVNIWIEKLKSALQSFFTDKPTLGYPADAAPDFEPLTLNFQPSPFSFQPTYDIDMAWSYKQKGFLRLAAGMVLRPSIARITALLGLKKDPFDAYEFLDDLHCKTGLQPVYFFLVAGSPGLYDKNILPTNESMQQLIKAHADKYRIGLHPSWKSNEQPGLLTEEKNMLEKIAAKNISGSRQHYIKFTITETFDNLAQAGVSDDYSMGYGSINGFRASAASSFLWYDLSKEKISTLRIHPFCFMDANCFYEQKLTVKQSYEELLHYYAACKKVNGTLITIFHNNFLGTGKAFAGWRELYIRFTSQLQ